MGVINITSNIGDGLYSAELKKDMTRADGNKILFQSQISIINTEISNIDNSIASVNNEISSINSSISSTISSINALPISDEEKYSLILEQTQNDLVSLSGKKFNLSSLSSSRESKLLSIQSKNLLIAQIDAKNAEVDNKDIWCVDFSISLPQGIDYKSYEVGRENGILFIAAHTYVIRQSDIDELDALINLKNTLISELISDKTDLNTQQNIINGEIQILTDQFNSAVTIDLKNDIKSLIVIKTAEVLKLIQEEKSLSVKIDRGIVSSGITTSLRDAYIATGVGSVYVPPVTTQTARLQPTISNGPMGSMFNKSLLPGIQRHRPSYRTAVILSILDDSCSIQLNSTFSSQTNAQTLLSFPINNDPLDNSNNNPIYTDVPIKYGACNGAVFAVSDDVVVSFEEAVSTTTPLRVVLSPVVVGFSSNPVVCGGDFFIALKYPGFDEKYTLRITNDGVNDVLTPLPFNPANLSGNITWTNGDENLSWDGYASRSVGTGLKIHSGFVSPPTPDILFIIDEFYTDGGAPANSMFVEYNNEWSNNIYRFGSVFLTGPAGKVITGASYNLGILTVLCHIDTQGFREIDYVYVYFNNIWIEIYQVNYDIVLNYVLPRQSPCFFSRDGTKVTTHNSSIVQATALSELSGNGNSQNISGLYINTEIRQLTIDLSTFDPNALGGEVSEMALQTSSLAISGVRTTTYSNVVAPPGFATISSTDTTVNAAMTYYACADWHYNPITKVETLSYLMIDIPADTTTNDRDSFGTTNLSQPRPETSYTRDRSINQVESIVSSVLINKVVAKNTLTESYAVDITDDTVIDDTYSQSVTANDFDSCVIEYCDLRSDIVSFTQNLDSVLETSSGSIDDSGTAIETQTGSETDTQIDNILFDVDPSSNILYTDTAVVVNDLAYSGSVRLNTDPSPKWIKYAAIGVITPSVTNVLKSPSTSFSVDATPETRTKLSKNLDGFILTYNANIFDSNSHIIGYSTGSSLSLDGGSIIEADISNTITSVDSVINNS